MGDDGGVKTRLQLNASTLLSTFLYVLPHQFQLNRSSECELIDHLANQSMF